MSTSINPPLEEPFAEGMAGALADACSNSADSKIRRYRLRDIALAAVANTFPSGTKSRAAPSEILLQEYLDALGDLSWQDVLEQSLLHPVPEDAPLATLARQLEFSPAEQLLIALATAVEDDFFVGRALSFAQAPIAGSRPTLGLAARAFHSLANGDTQSLLFSGNAV